MQGVMCANKCSHSSIEKLEFEVFDHICILLHKRQAQKAVGTQFEDRLERATSGAQMSQATDMNCTGRLHKGVSCIVGAHLHLMADPAHELEETQLVNVTRTLQH